MISDSMSSSATLPNPAQPIATRAETELYLACVHNIQVGER